MGWCFAAWEDAELGSENREGGKILILGLVRGLEPGPDGDVMCGGIVGSLGSWQSGWPGSFPVLWG